MFGILLLLHVIGATIWTGGHIVLSVVVLPRVIQQRSPEALLEFESVYEKIGMPALVTQIITGVLLAFHMIPDIGQWVDFANPITHVLWLKFSLLLITFCFALSARFRVIPNLCPDTLKTMAWHIIPVTILSVLFVIVGVSFRTGWFY
ncbi:CopD family protein [Vibrio profundi]|uniref:CopD family protein n=1 Tax=Vibrio profundi TaxID=1774960 RepID=UPI003736FFAF